MRNCVELRKVLACGRARSFYDSPASDYSELSRAFCPARQAVGSEAHDVTFLKRPTTLRFRRIDRVILSKIARSRLKFETSLCRELNRALIHAILVVKLNPFSVAVLKLHRLRTPHRVRWLGDAGRSNIVALSLFNLVQNALNPVGFVTVIIPLPPLATAAGPDWCHSGVSSPVVEPVEFVHIVSQLLRRGLCCAIIGCFSRYHLAVGSFCPDLTAVAWAVAVRLHTLHPQHIALIPFLEAALPTSLARTPGCSFRTFQKNLPCI